MNESNYHDISFLFTLDWRFDNKKVIIVIKYFLFIDI